MGNCTCDFASDHRPENVNRVLHIAIENVPRRVVNSEVSFADVAHAFSGFDERLPNNVYKVIRNGFKFQNVYLDVHNKTE